MVEKQLSGTYSLRMTDPFLERRASAIVSRTRNGSTSHLARSLNVSWNEAFELMRQMEREGEVSAPNATGRRIVLHAANDRGLT